MTGFSALLRVKDWIKVFSQWCHRRTLFSCSNNLSDL